MVALRAAATLLLGVGVSMAAPALAQRHDDRFYGRAGAFIASVDSKLRIDSSTGSLGTSLDLESDLGLNKSQTLPFVQAGLRFGRNWRVEAEFFSLSRKGNISLDEAITVGDTVYGVAADLNSRLKTDIYRIAFGYSFINHENFELGADLGFHLSDFKVGVEGIGSVNGDEAVVRAERRDQLVPLPTLGLYTRFDLNKTFSLVGRVDYFALKIDRYRGELIDTSAGINARVTRNLGVGADFRYVSYKLRASADDFSGRVSYDFYGPFLYLELGF